MQPVGGGGSLHWTFRPRILRSSQGSSRDTGVRSILLDSRRISRIERRSTEPGNPTSAGTTDPLELYSKLVATNPRVERKGATMPYTSVNGHTFGFLTKTGKLALRLPTEEREAFLKK